MKKRKTIIQDKVFEDVENIYNYIKEESPQNAENFKQDVQQQIEKAAIREHFTIINSVSCLFSILHNLPLPPNFLIVRIENK